MYKETSKRDLRIFGFIWALIFAFFSYKFSVKFVYVAAFFFLISALHPHFFVQIKFYQSWIKLGNFLGKVNGFLISLLLFYFLFTPIAIILKLMKKDPLNKKLNTASSTYFIDRNTQPGDMKNQF